MNDSNSPTDSEQPIDQQRDEEKSTVECVICDHALLNKDTVISYHPSDDPAPSLISGYLCPVCRLRIESILDDEPKECEKCGAPFPQSRRMDVWEHDVNGCPRRVLNLCYNCLIQY